MGRAGPWLAAGAGLLLQGCDINYATFVTATHVGIKADAKTEQVAIGIGRTDLFVGPGYPDQGTAPSAFGYLRTNGQVFNPQVTQLYATGAAADGVTQQGQPAPTATPVLSGTRRPLVFATNTDVGLKLGFVANLPSSIDLGYNREEVSIVPMRPVLEAGQTDVYAPVLAAVTLNVSAPNQAAAGLTIGQFFATGMAATNLAASPKIQSMFMGAAAAQISQAALEAAVSALNKRTVAVKAFLDGPGGYAPNCAKLKASPAFHPQLWPVADPCGLSETDFLATLNHRPDLASAAFDALPATP